MKLTSLELYSNDQVVAVLSLVDYAGLNPYQIISSTGLDADEIIPKFYGFSKLTNKRQYNLSVPNRQITLKIGLNPNFGLGKSYSDLRDDLSKAIASTRSGLIQLRFKNGSNILAVIEGFISAFEAPRFSKTQEVQLSINCTSPMFRAPTPVSITTAGLGTSFNIVDNDSTAPHGFKFTLTFNANTASFVIKDSLTPEWTFTLTPENIAGLSGFKTNDTLHFSSEDGDKYIYVVRSSVVYHIADSIEQGSTWPLIFPNTNPFVITTDAFTWGVMSHYPTYWSV